MPPAASAATQPSRQPGMVTGLKAVLRREFAGYFTTPVAYVFVVVFLILAALLTFAPELGNLYGRGQADLQPFFTFHPWLYLFFAPALAMRLWSEERRAGTLEILMTLPIPTPALVLGKFLAAWAFLGLGLALTCGVWITVACLGHPDHGAILASYFGSLLLAGAFLAIGSLCSALSRNQAVAFVVAVTACFLLMLSGLPFVQNSLLGSAPAGLRDAVAGLSAMTRFDALSHGEVPVPDVLYFLGVIFAGLAGTAITLDSSRESQ